MARQLNQTIDQVAAEVIVPDPITELAPANAEFTPAQIAVAVPNCTADYVFIRG